MSRRFAARTSELRALRSAIEREALRFGFSSDVAATVVLAVDEAAANVIEHSYGDAGLQQETRSTTILVEVITDDRRFEVRITDSGVPYPGKRPGKLDLRKKVEAGNNGGLGLHIIHRVMDDVRYTPRTGPSNTLRMVKYLT